MNIKRHIAAASLALALALGGAFGISTQDVDGSNSDVTEQAGGTWSFTVGGGKGGWHGTHGSTWS